MPADLKSAPPGAARMLAVYGKGGMGKSFFTTNLVSKLALLGHRVLQLGCDPKHDSCNALFGGVSLPTLGDVWRAFKEAGREEELQAQHVIFKTRIMGGATVYGCEIGGPEVGRGCGGRGITFGFDLLEKLGLSRWALDYVVMDFLGDVVCGGFATPLSRSLAEEVIILCGNDRQSLYAANNIASAARYFASMGGRTRLVGLVVNRDDGSGVAARFAERINLPVLASIPLDRTVRELADACKLALSEPRFDAIFERLAQQIVARATPPVEMDAVRPLEYREFLSVFGADEPDIVPEGACAEELFGGRAAPAVPVLELELMSRAVGDQPDLDPVARRVVKRLLKDLGMYVTEASHDPRKGLTLTVDGHTTILSLIHI
ncbi:MAG: chlorophyllide a reductase iron protein subunit X, partial [Chloroflexaceae bacterium]|nr:chlorophyllide a reductase iron protein subunit X [Chloroflexaceae bacterium]